MAAQSLAMGPVCSVYEGNEGNALVFLLLCLSSPEPPVLSELELSCLGQSTAVIDLQQMCPPGVAHNPTRWLCTVTTCVSSQRA
jgi:hypothetical protein